jgi:excisionase family DNA binding protein
MAHSSPASGIDPSVIDELAERLGEIVVQRLIDVIKAEGLMGPVATGGKWLSAQEVAERLGVSREWVYEHADELGASRIGRGRRPRLRFPPAIDPRLNQAPPVQPEPPRGLDVRSGLIPIRPS